jgi:hypothetical protein
VAHRRFPPYRVRPDGRRRDADSFEEAHRERFRDGWISLADKFNVARDGTCEIPSEYLGVVAVKA